MLNFKREYIALEQDRLLYPVSFKEKAKCNVYGRKKFITESGKVELSAHVFLISKDFWTISAGQLDFTNYPNGIWNEYISIDIIEREEYTAPTINFRSMGDITPENLQGLSNYISKHLSDLERRIVEDYLFIDEGVSENIELPNLPENHFWVKKHGVIVGVNLDYLKADYEHLKNELWKNYESFNNKLQTALKKYYDDLELQMNNFFKNLIDKIREEAEKQLGLIAGAGGGLLHKIDQANHGFIFDPIVYENGVWKKATTTSGVDGIGVVISSNTFFFLEAGEIEVPQGATDKDAQPLLDDEYYYMNEDGGTGFQKEEPVWFYQPLFHTRTYKGKLLANVHIDTMEDLRGQVVDTESGRTHGIALWGDIVPKFDTIEKLQKAFWLKEGEVVEVLGYYTAGDGAGHKRIIKAEDDGSGVQVANNLWANIVHNGEVNVSWFGAKGDGVTDDTEAIQKALVYIQGIKIDENKEYTKQELEKIEQNKNKKIQKLIIDGNFRITKKIIFTLGYEIETPAINGAYGNKEKLFGIYYDGVSDFAAFSTASFIKQENGNYKFIKSKEDINRLIVEYSNIDNIILNITGSMIFNVNLGAKEGTPVTFLFGGNQSKISGKIGMLSNSGDISTIFLRAWETKCENVHFYGAYQSVVNIKCNNSHVFKNCYFTNYRNKTFQKYRIIPTDCPWDLTNEFLNIYNFNSASIFYNPVMEGGNYHMCSDNGSINSIFSPYFETHNPPEGTLAGFLILNNSKIDSFGGMFPKSNSGGHCVRAYNNDTSYSSYFNTTKSGSGGYLISTKNCEAEYTFDNLNDGYKNDSALCKNKTEIYKLEKIHINNFEKKIIEWRPSMSYISSNASDDLEVCLWLAKERNAKEIKLMEDKILEKEIPIDLPNITFNLNRKTLSIKDSNSFFDLKNNVDMISFYGGNISGTQNDTDYLARSIVFKTINMVFEQINFVNKFMVYGGYRDCLTNSCINIYNSNLDNFTGKYIAGTTAGFKTIDNYKVYVSNKTTDQIKFTLLNSPMAKLIGTNNKTVVANEIQQLNTPYMATKMQQEGVYNDFTIYMDEKTAYDKQQQQIEKDRQLAYEEALKSNPNLTYEEFLSAQPVTLAVDTEPQPSQALQDFMKKYL